AQAKTENVLDLWRRRTPKYLSLSQHLGATIYPNDTHPPVCHQSGMPTRTTAQVQNRTRVGRVSLQQAKNIIDLGGIILLVVEGIVVSRGVCEHTHIRISCKASTTRAD